MKPERKLCYVKQNKYTVGGEVDQKQLELVRIEFSTKCYGSEGIIISN